MVLVDVFATLRLKPGLILRAYRMQVGGNGSGVVYVMPEQAPLPTPEECPLDVERVHGPPLPPQALKDVMGAVEGDGTPLAFLSASLFAREVSEFGAMWHGESWQAHILIATTDPISVIQRENASISSDFHAEEWTWERPLPAQWRPIVRQSNGSTIVIFHTYTALGQQCIVQHVDRYQGQSYRFETTTRVVAYGPAGYIP